MLVNFTMINGFLLTLIRGIFTSKCFPCYFFFLEVNFFSMVNSFMNFLLSISDGSSSVLEIYLFDYRGKELDADVQPIVHRALLVA